ncbi:hypothetical protein PHET_05892 [Paragonimus heterotremus]|uniref:TIR domain-containing protein n=1 Tax=Paragonimus heterotremus TaxID=100268 RepID=A0A8J4SPA9_9TREM|nr:hypothetical protein PHET_05892 [Paragonimus heterotremus]
MYRTHRGNELKLRDRTRLMQACIDNTREVVNNLILFASTKFYKSEEFSQALATFLRSYYIISKPVSFSEEYRTRVCEEILSTENIPDKLGAIFNDLASHELNYRLQSSEGSQNNGNLKLLIDLQRCIFSYLDASPKFGLKMVANQAYMQTVRLLLTDLLSAVDNVQTSNEIRSLVRYLIGSVYNALRHGNPGITQRVIELGFTEVVKPYAFCDDPKIQMSAYMFLAYSETHKDQLEMHETETIQAFIQCLEMATKSVNKRGKGYSVLELAKGLRILAQNDGNKQTLVQLGILPCLKVMLESGIPDEEEEALLMLWTLSFDEKIKKQIRGEFGESVLKTQLQIKMRETRLDVELDEVTKPGNLQQALPNPLVVEAKMSNFHGKRLDSVPQLEVEEEPELVKSRTELKNKAALKALKGLIWQLSVAEEKHAHSEPKIQPPSTDPHVMISYNHQHKKIASQIASQLKENYKVWIDLDYMSSEVDVMEGMASAVENAFVVCILYSKAYKDSPSTRSEAQYAYRMQKPLLFLRVQPDYEPDGWLGILIGTKYYIDFSGKYPFETKFGVLLKSVNKAMQTRRGTITPITQETTQMRPDTQEGANKTYDHWNEAETANWLRRINVEWSGSVPLNGCHLTFLSKLLTQAPAFYYEALKSEGCLKDLTALMNFSNALEQLSLN